MWRVTGVFVVAWTGCGFSARLGDVDAPPMVDDAGREIRTWSFDSAAELAAVGHATRAMSIDPRGSLTPHGYVYGGLVARGLAGVKLWTNTDADWDKLATVTPTAVGLWIGDDLATTQDLRFAGIEAAPPMLSMWFEGEIFLDATTTQIRAAGNDTAFVYVATDGTTFQKLAHDATGPVAVAQAGWYPIRVGWADGDAGGDLELALDAGAGLVPVPRVRLRAPASALQGTLRTVYYRQVHGGGIRLRPPTRQVQETALHAATTFVPPLPGSTTVVATPYDWSARWTGQFYATTAGSYTFRVQSSDGNRLLVGTAAPMAARYARNDNGNATSQVTADLVEGWNDLVVDYNDVSGNMTLNVAITAAAEAQLAGMPVPKDRLRPVEPRGDRLITASAVPATPITIPDNDNTLRFLEASVSAHPTELVTAVEVTAILRTTRPNDLAYQLIAPDGATLNPTMVQNADGPLRVVHYAGTHGAGAPAGGRWRLGVVDNNGGGNATTYEELHVTVHTTGGPEQIAPTAWWRSPIVEHATAVSQIDAITWDERAPGTATVVVRMRTCDDAACDGDAWSEPITKGTPPTLPAQRYLQLEVEMTSDGTHEPELRSLMAQYRTDPK